MGNSDEFNPTEYSELNDILEILISSMQGILVDDFVGAYLQGSFAAGDYDLHSDVDFTIVVEEVLSKEQVEALQEMHGRIHDLESH